MEETVKQQSRLRNVIAKLGGTPTKEKVGLPILTSPEHSRTYTKTMKKMMSAAEKELKECEQDTIIENAEVTGYNMLINSQLLATMLQVKHT